MTTIALKPVKTRRSEVIAERKPPLFTSHRVAACNEMACPRELHERVIM